MSREEIDLVNGKNKVHAGYHKDEVVSRWAHEA